VERKGFNVELPNRPLIIPKPADRQQWLAERRKGIGGSDSAAAVGLSKWTTRLELFLDKRGELEKHETPQMRWGTALEQPIRQEYCNQTGAEVLIPDAIYQHPDHKFALVNLDGIVINRERIFEAKTARSGEGWGEPGTDEVPAEYLLQAQHGMAITGLPATDIAVLIAGSDFRIYVVEADRSLQSMLLEREAEFWDMVEQNTPPEPTTLEDVKLRWRVAQNDSPAIATEEDARAVIELAQLKKAMKDAEARDEALRARLQGVIRDSASLVTPAGDLLATWKNVNAAPRFDMEQFKREQPDLYQQYLREASPRRMFLLKVKG
jgi:putative phage-type endonuclease